MLWLRRRKSIQPKASPFLTKQRFQFIRGRSIVQGIPYLLPKDDEEINRLDFQHFMLRSALGGLCAAPIRYPHAILDVATGTGRWAIDMAKVFPRATVTGLDIIAPPADDASAGTYAPGTRPANYTFQQGDIFAGLPFTSGSFDFVHMRLVYAATPVDKWQPLVEELVRVTKPGGYIELVEGFVLLDVGPATTAIQNAAIELSKRRNIDVTYGKNIGHLLKLCGILNVQERGVSIPVGRQHGRLGALAEQDILSVFKALGNAAVANGILDAEDFNRLYAEMTGELTEAITTWPVFQAFGKKPLGALRR
jgi:ubiquinone/menaquinone biosynthesis C-methylase UbiE